MKESLRGALLSVLFFALLIGGAPTMAAASGSLMSVTSAHHNFGGSNNDDGDENDGRPSQAERYETFCDSMKMGMGAGTGMVAVGGTAAALGGPPGMAVGATRGGAGAITISVFGAGYFLGGCWR